ncbi:gas vesicle protein GvpL [Halopelagius longus]|uniref:Gas vesicle protein GvpFL n=1 Tax=Halopelagius longus TaxID=1236180 RepID=A0A1H0XX17_9EURY|nr:GvpL/GvpF family gas vesicle protein [Halopelagius longus]RDI72145.1 gas vesicle protein GvpFL [Halopelagius longus]SDQ07423.1 Gas vesicle synthesis protein GvpL/GvpF [Halopelagius longus]
MSDAADASSAEFDEGRYLYCVVRADDADAEFDVEGIEDEPVRVLTEGDVGAVVHRCESLYDSDDPTTLKRWLLAHQRVTDAAADAFGTPLPVRFDTVLTGDDDTVREWLRESADGLRDALDALAGRREYRIEVRRNEDTLADRLAETDDRLGELREKKEEAGEGTGFLVGKQYEQRLEDLLREHRENEAEAVAEELARYAERVQRLGENRSASLVGAQPDDDDATSSVRFAVLAPVDNEDDIGEILDDVAAEDGVEVRFSGPWPPYSFAPELDVGATEEGSP